MAGLMWIASLILYSDNIQSKTGHMNIKTNHLDTQLWHPYKESYYSYNQSCYSHDQSCWWCYKYHMIPSFDFVWIQRVLSLIQSVSLFKWPVVIFIWPVMSSMWKLVTPTTQVIVKQFALDFTLPKIEKVVLKAFCKAVSAFWRFENCKIRPKRHGKTPAWTTFDFGPGKVKCNLLY